LKTYLSFKDILFIPEDEKNLLGLGDIAVILKTALLGADYDLGKRRDFNLMRYVQERLGVTSEQNVLNQFEEWAQFSLKADNLRLTLSEKEREFLSRSAKGNFEFFNSSGIDQRSGLPFDYVIAKDPSPPPAQISESDIEELIRQVIQLQHPDLTGSALDEKVQETVASWLSLTQGVSLFEMSEEIIGSTIERENLPQAGFTVNPDSTQQIRFSLLEGTNLSDFHTLRFLVKAGNPELLNRFRIKFFYETNGEEYVFISPVMKEVDKEVRELEDGWVEFRINLSSLRNTIDESITWEDIKDKVTNILFVTESRDFEGLNRRDKRRLKTYLSFKDILFIPEDEKNLLGLGDIAVILKTALLGADYDLGKRRDFNLMRYVQERLGVTSEQNVLNQFEEWAQFSLKADNLRLTLSEKEREFLSRSAKGNFEFFNSSGIDQRSGLPFDYVIAKDPSPVYGRYTKISNIGMALASYVAGYEMGLISKQEVVAKISKVFDTLDNVEVYEVPEGPLKGKKFLYEGYELDKRNEEGKLLPILNRSISSIDTAWFLVGLILVKEVFKDVDEIAVRANYWLENNDLRLFYDETRHLFRVLYRYYPDRDELVDEYPDARYTVFSSETRILSYLALGLGVVNEEEFRRHWQTLSKPKSSDLGTEYEGIDLVLSWAGGAFEFGMPALFVDEAKLFPQGQGINLYKAMVLQKLWVENNGYPVFGESPSTDENYHYDIFGAQDIHPQVRLCPDNSGKGPGISVWFRRRITAGRCSPASNLPGLRFHPHL